jgi:hypothetical protein
VGGGVKIEDTQHFYLGISDMLHLLGGMKIENAFNLSLKAIGWFSMAELWEFWRVSTWELVKE